MANRNWIGAWFGWFLVLAPLQNVLGSGPFINMGPAAFGGAYDQPFVQVTLYDGSEELGPSQLRKTFLLDTGANGILAVGEAASELHRQGNFSEDYFEEIGVGGTILYQVSAEYSLEVAGTNSVWLDNVRILSDPTTSFGESVFFEGLVGMPAMVGRVTSLDMNLGGPLGGGLDGIDWSDLDELIDAISSNFSGIGVSFHDQMPASNGHRYSVPTRPLYFDADQGGISPTYAPLTVVTAEHYSACNTISGDNYIVDTGAQLSFISLDKARALGLDPDNPFSTITITGVGGNRTVPVFFVEEIRLPTAEGPDLVWTGVEVVGLDLHPSIDGVIGSDLLTAGMVEIDLTATDLDDLIKVGDGPIEKVHFDFRELDLPDQSGQGFMVFDMNPRFDRTIVPGDATRDGKVDQADLQVVLSNWNTALPIQTEEGEIFYGQEMGDFNFDCTVDISDLVTLAGQWNYGVASPAAPLDIERVLSSVPEPAVGPLTAVLLLSASFASLRCKRRAPRRR